MYVVHVRKYLNLSRLQDFCVSVNKKFSNLKVIVLKGNSYGCYGVRA